MLIFLLFAILLAYIFYKLLPLTALSILLSIIILAVGAFGCDPTVNANAPPTCVGLIVCAVVVDIAGKIYRTFKPAPKKRRVYYVED